MQGYRYIYTYLYLYRHTSTLHILVALDALDSYSKDHAAIKGDSSRKGRGSKQRDRVALVDILLAGLSAALCALQWGLGPQLNPHQDGQRRMMNHACVLPAHHAAGTHQIGRQMASIMLPLGGLGHI
jgi:hypothetical protein